MADTQRDPILIAGSPRSGTSMLAGLLYVHGVWIGKSAGTRYPGSNTPLGTENHDIKAILKTRMDHYGYKGWRDGLPPDPGKLKLDYRLREEILSVAPTSGPWLIKTSRLLWFWPLIVDAFPSALWVLPRRDTKDIIASWLRHPGMGRRTSRAYIKVHVADLYQRQMAVYRAVGGSRSHFVYVDDIVQGEDKALQDLMTFCGLRLDPDRVSSWIEPEKWRGDLTHVTHES